MTFEVTVEHQVPTEHSTKYETIEIEAVNWDGVVSQLTAKYGEDNFNVLEHYTRRPNGSSPSVL